ncbi:unnamed protein product [Orchesella dallaii]|uniref:Uncharacterized protein n=1 Tax=Orchesella dallaii TaxID=48710 RepID=A0ABP1QZN9_9HEXA
MARMLLPLWFEVICAVLSLLPQFSTLLAQSVDRLDLNPQLELFRMCSISVVVNHAHLDQNDEFMGSYETGPFNVPVILSFIRYEQAKKIKRIKNIGLPTGFKATRFYCDEKTMQLVPSRGFYSYVSPAPKSSCFVQMYIAPKSCHKWEHNARLPMSRMEVYSLFPDSFLNPIFDRRTNLKEGRAEKFSLEKANLIFIFVNRKPFDLYLYSGNIFSLVDYLWSYPYENSENGVLPTKLLFEVEPSPKEGLGIVTSTSVLTCSDYQYMAKGFKRYCGNTRKHDNPTGLCLTIAAIVYWEPPELITYSNLQDISSWKQLEAYRSSCQKNIIVTRSDHAAVTSDKSYLSDLTNKIKAANYSIQVEPFLLRLLCSNCTIASYMELPVSGLNIFPTFDLAVSPFPRTQFSVTTDSNLVHFVTCSPLEKEGYLSLLGYVSAFDVGTWITAFVASVISGRLWYRYAKIPIYKRNRNRDKWFHALFVYNVLLAQGTSAVGKMRWITGSWIMTGIVLTYFYQGDNINRLIAPLSTSKLQSFDAILEENLTIYSPFVDTAEIKADYIEVLNIGSKYTKLLLRAANDSNDNVELKTVFGAKFSIKHAHKTYKEVIRLLSTITRTPHTLATAIPTLDFDYFVNKISKCDKDVYVDTLDNIQRMKLQLNKYGISEKRTTVSNHAYGQMFNDWMFHGNPWPLEGFVLRVHSLFQSGIVQLWRSWKFRVETWADTVQFARNAINSPKPVSTGDNFVVVFYVHVLLLLVALLAFMFEARGVLQVWLKDLLRITGSFIQRIWHSMKWLSDGKLLRWYRCMKNSWKQMKLRSKRAGFYRKRSRRRNMNG